MTYRDQLVGLSQECERQVLAVYALFTAGQISAQETATVIATIVTAHNSKAAALADISLAATIMLALGHPVPTAGVLPRDGDVERLRKAASTVLQVADRSEVPEAIVGRLARAEPLETAAASYSEAMNTNKLVKGWVRNVSGDACQLCRWWWRDGRIWPAEHPMPTHKGCTCTPKPLSPRTFSPPDTQGGYAMPDDENVDNSGAEINAHKRTEAPEGDPMEEVPGERRSLRLRRFRVSTSRSCAKRTAATANAPNAATTTPSACTSSWFAPPASSPTRPTCRSTRTTSTTPKPWPSQ